MFFINENKSVNKPVFKVKCIVWAKSHDGDCEKPWGENGASVEWVFTMPDFNNTNIFSAWNCLDLHLKIE
jgi:hypothetical protein